MRKKTPPIEDLKTHPRQHVSAAQLAEYVMVTRKTIYNQIAKGAIATVKIGGVIRIRKNDALAYVQEPVPSKKRHASAY